MENWKKVFAIIWTGQFLSILSSTIVNFAVILWISIETGSAEMLSYAAIAALLPQVLIGPASGVYIDRWNRKTVMILADSFVAFCTLILAILFWLDVAEMFHIFILLALRSVGSAFHMPAMQAAVPMLAPKEELTRIAGINQIIQSVGNIAGPALAGMFIVLWDMEYILMLDVAGAIFACTALAFVHIPMQKILENADRDILAEMKQGVKVVWRNRGLSWVFLFSIGVMFFIMPLSILFPLMTLDHFNGTPVQVSIIEALWGAGALIGGTIMGIKVYRINKVILVNCMYLWIGLVFILCGFLPSDAFIWFAILTTINGVSGAMYNSSFTGIVQTMVEPEALGRVFSMYYTCSLLPSLLGLIGIGFFADNLGITTSFIVCGVIILILGILSFIPPSALRIDSVNKNA